MSGEISLEEPKKRKIGLFITIGVILILAVGGLFLGYQYHTAQVE